MIKQNIAGIKFGAEKLMQKGIISPEVEQEIIDCVDKATIVQFQPVILIIPYSLVQSELSPVAAKNRANPLSNEFIIAALTRDKFDIIEF